MKNKKFILLDESLKAIQKGSINLLAVKGEAGTGKSRTILNYLKKEKVKFKFYPSLDEGFYTDDLVLIESDY